MDFLDLVKKKITEPLHLRIKVLPRRPKTEYADTLEDGTIRIRLAAVPDRGRANEELIRYLAELFGCAESRVRIISGHIVAKKFVRIDPE